MFIKHDLTKIPRDIKRETIIITIFGVITSVGFDALSFFLQLGKNQIASGNIIAGLVLISVYYTKNTLDSTIRMWMEDTQITYREHYRNTINNKVAEILLKVRGKVWRTNEETNSKEVMSTNALLLSCKKYITLLWDFKTGLPRQILQIISVICMFIGFVIVTTVEIKNTMLFIVIILIVSICSVLFSIKRIRLRNRYRKSRKHAFEKQDMALNDILNIEPVNQKHASYMVKNYIDASKQIYDFDRKDRRGINKVNLGESFIDSIATICIIGIKVYETGIDNIDLTVVLSIIALITIYTQIMSRVNNIVHMLEDCKGNLEEINNYKLDFLEIIQVLDKEKLPTGDFGRIENVTVPTFKVQYKALGSEKPFSLRSEEEIKLSQGDIVLLIGPTGSGKSTFMKMITQMVRFNDFELFYKRKKNGTINSIMHQTDGRLGCNSVLSEIVFDEEVDEEKMIYILKGLHLYEEIEEKEKNVIRYLETSTVKDYSTGQKQRLAIARLLYNMDDTMQIIGFDEATNALNDAITMQTLKFIKEYCADKILLIATHQVAIGETIATQKFEFLPSNECYKLIKK